MTNPVADPLIAQLGKWRLFFQEQRNPNGAYQYRGKTQIGGVNTPLGDDTLITTPSRTRANAWDITDVAVGQPGLPNTDFTAHLNKTLRDIYHRLKRTNCRFNIQAKYDSCGRPDDFFSWESKYLGVAARMTDLTFPQMNPLSGDDNAVSQLTGSLSMFVWVEILKLKFEEQADSVILAEVLDGFYNDVVDCGDCGQFSDGCGKFYCLTLADAGSPGLSSQIVFTDDGKATWQTIDIPPLGGNSGSKIAAVGNRLIVIAESTNSHFHIRFSDLHALVTTAWSEVSSGYVENPLDIYSKSPGETFISGRNGYIYKLDDVTTAPTVLTDGSIVTDDLNVITGIAETIVAGGENGALLVSNNSGEAFASMGITLKDGSVIATNVTAIGMLDDTMWFVGAGGSLYFTTDGGTTYTQKVLDGGISVINDIAFYDDNVGYIACEVAGAGRVYRTDSMGWNWYYQDGISSLPSAVRYNFVAPCWYNEVATGGRVTIDGDGLLAVAN
jgi:hypothetical protein